MRKSEKTDWAAFAGYAALVLALGLFATACDPTSEDRGGGREMFGGSDVDSVEDVSEIIVYRNANNWPNFAQVCAGGEAYVMRRSGGDAGSTVVMPDPQRSEECGG